MARCDCSGVSERRAFADLIAFEHGDTRAAF
jgi:hypothetical protein